jgi:Domain of unknown function (DUF4112)
MDKQTFDFSSLAGGDIDATYRRIELLEHVLERAFVVPGTSKRIGLDAVLGLVPVVGDVLSGAIALMILAEGRRLGMPKATLMRMLFNVAVDTGLGAIPLVGDVWDALFASNSKNLKLLKKHLDKHAGVIKGEVLSVSVGDPVHRPGHKAQSGT